MNRIKNLMAVVLSTALVASVPSVAYAQSSDLSSESSSDFFYELGAEALSQWSHIPTVSRDLNELFKTFHAHTHWQGFPIWNLYGNPTPYPASQAQSFDRPELLRREPDERFPVERLFISSPAMGRVVQVQVRYPKDRSKPAPMLTILDGVTAPRQSGWLREGNILGAMANEHVTVVMPTEATGSNYTDWSADDPFLGRMKWETFLIHELPQVLEDPATGMNFDGTRFIGGLSMGGSAAVRLANLYPDRFAGVFSVSGCYSSVNTSGREFFNFITRSVGGSPDLTWGRGVTEQRRRNDTVANPSGLKDMRVYLFTSDGAVTAQDREFYRQYGVSELFGGIVLEKMVNRCTRELDDSMRAHGMTHQRVDYQIGGIHDWPYYKAQLPVAWAHVSQGKYTYS